MKVIKIFCGFIGVYALLAGCTSSSNKKSSTDNSTESATKQWTRLFGTTKHDAGNGVAVDSSGNIYVTGESYGNFDNQTNSGSADMFLIKYNSSGNKQWSRLLGTIELERAYGVAVDSSGNIYVTGESRGHFDNQTNSGGPDMFLVKYDSSGNKKWSKLFGTAEHEHANGVAVDSSNNVYVTGYSAGNFDNQTNFGDDDVFLVKYDSSGNKKWSRLFGTAKKEHGRGVAVDSSGDIYVTGESYGNFDNQTNSGSADMFLIKYNPSGNKQWSKLLGSAKPDTGRGVAVDSSDNVYVTGEIRGYFGKQANSGSADMFLIKYNPSGSKQWSRLLGSTKLDIADGVAVDSSNNIYVTGWSEGNFDGKTNAGDHDLFLVKYNSSGNKQWSALLGVFEHDAGNGVAVDSSANIYVTGWSEGNFDNQTSAGDADLFLVKYH